MKGAGIEAVIIPQSDPHLSEYLAAHWQVRRWLSGFTGSAGDLVVTADKALLWTDSRYFLQAAQQLAGSGIELMKDGLPETPSITAYLVNHLKSGDTVGVDGMLFASGALASLRNDLAKAGLKLNTTYDAAARWADRPALPQGKIYVHDAKYAGLTPAEKIAKVLAEVKAAGADATFISALDEIAWILNIRCDDVKHTPVATSYIYLSDDQKILFIAPEKVGDAEAAHLASAGVEMRPYTDASKFLASLPQGVKVLIEPAHTSGAVVELLAGRVVEVPVSPAMRLKAVKNDVQIAGIRKAMVRDGVALVKVFMEIEKRLAKGVKTTELDVAEIVLRHRSAGENFRDESFGTIAGYGPHGAIVHYEADEHSSSTLKPEGLLLVDSGAQYLDGTTDITRTVCLGTPTAEEKRDFTLVMKGHICLATIKFPEGTRGAQLDALARQFLWRNGMTYLHGTGHGVGHFLGVHEGPQSIRLNWVDTPLQPGMLTSNEPGLYRENVHGIRCENLVLCVHDTTNEFGTFLSFETMTLFPFDRALFDLSLMSEQEIEWVNNYHQRVRESLTPYLDAEQAAWLKEKTEKL